MMRRRFKDFTINDLPDSIKAMLYRCNDPEPQVFPFSACDNDWQDASQIEGQIDSRKLALSLLFVTTKKEADVLSMRYMKDMTLEEVGFAYGVTRERIRQIEEKAMRKIRRKFETLGAEGCIKQYREYMEEVT